MSVQAMSWVFDHSPTTLGARLVLLSLANHASSDGGEIWPSQATIAQEARLSERQVRRCLKELEAGGHIVRCGKKFRAVKWRIVMEAIPDISASQRTNRAISTDIDVLQTIHEPPKEPSVKEKEDFCGEGVEVVELLTEAEIQAEGLF
jgi:DNA-binding Lrp family transcriptional regulator